MVSPRNLFRQDDETVDWLCGAARRGILKSAHGFIERQDKGNALDLEHSQSVGRKAMDTNIEGDCWQKCVWSERVMASI